MRFIFAQKCLVTFNIHCCFYWIKEQQTDCRDCLSHTSHFEPCADSSRNRAPQSRWRRSRWTPNGFALIKFLRPSASIRPRILALNSLFDTKRVNAVLVATLYILTLCGDVESSGWVALRWFWVMLGSKVTTHNLYILIFDATTVDGRRLHAMPRRQLHLRPRSVARPNFVLQI